MKNIFKQRGFTLVEIILVIALIGVTASIVVTLIDPVRQFRKANDAKRKADLRQFQAALELYKADQGVYPTPATWPGYTCGSPLVEGGTTYMQKMPCDPRNSGNHIYRYTEVNVSGNTYSLISCLENIQDTERDQPNRPNPSGGTYCSGSTQTSYTLNNP
jgi:prepilin-type N-terminal cleavage/methylation domain-containing protein